MKRSIFALAVVVATVVIGCQESSSTDPFGSASTQANPVSRVAIPANTIPLQGEVQGPNAQYWIGGQVSYSLTQLPIMRDDVFDLVLDVDAKIMQTNSNEASWKVNNSSSERVNFTGQTSVKLDKWYFLRGGPSSLNLHIQFSVTTTSITLTLIAIE